MGELYMLDAHRPKPTRPRLFKHCTREEQAARLEMVNDIIAHPAADETEQYRQLDALSALVKKQDDAHAAWWKGLGESTGEDEPPPDGSGPGRRIRIKRTRMAA
jgi:hypothetical protein